ncbi:hypothetical protein QCN27_03390 [Cereibacter sp. SYSU M97828]|nr:hypothetical protein [Cereibacter flavus]
MIDFVRRSARWLGTAEYSYVTGVVWLGAMPIPVFWLRANEALRVSVLLMLWLATAALTAVKIAYGPLPAPTAVAHWLSALV